MEAALFVAIFFAIFLAIFFSITSAFLLSPGNDVHNHRGKHASKHCLQSKLSPQDVSVPRLRYLIERKPCVVLRIKKTVAALSLSLPVVRNLSALPLMAVLESPV